MNKICKNCGRAKNEHRFVNGHIKCGNIIDGDFTPSGSFAVSVEFIEAVRKLTWKINRVSAPHRHGFEPAKKDLDDLSNYQIEIEAMLKQIDKEGT